MKSVVEHLTSLVRIPSISRLSNRPVIDYARSVLDPAGWQFREQLYRDAEDIEKVNLIAAPPGASAEDRQVELALVCHTDTVPFSESWKHATDPYVENGQLHGCGACDVKGFLACILTAALAPESRPVHRGLRIVLTADEEVGCVGTSHLMEAASIQPRRVVIGEPTSLQPARAGKGYCLAGVTVSGREAHSAHPQQGASAIYAAAELIGRIRAIETEMRQYGNAFFDPPFTTLNVGTIHGGTAKNIVAGECMFQLEWRPLPGQPQDAVIQHARKAAEELEQNWHGHIQCRIQVLRTQPGFETPADAPLVRTLEAMTGKNSMAIPFGSEAPYFATVAEQVVVFGPGDMRTAHSERESVPVEHLHKAVNILKPLMRE